MDIYITTYNLAVWILNRTTPCYFSHLLLLKYTLNRIL